MSILINQVATPNRIKALAEVVASESEMTRDELRRRFMPRENDDQFKSLVREAIHLGVLVDKKVSKSIALSSELSKKKVTNRTHLFAYCRACLISNSGNDSSGNENFPRALAWFLTRPIGPYTEVGAEFRTELLNDLEGEEYYELKSAPRSGMLIYWAQALGFGEWLNFKDSNYFNPDPTRALSATLGEVLEKKHQTPINDVLKKCGRKVPVFETGRIRDEVESRLKIEKRRDPNYISQSTSLAFLRLEQRGAIKLDHLADAPTLLLSTMEKRDRPVSHVTLIKI